MGCTRFCHYCGVTKTPMWRSGPQEFSSLCNSCGIKWTRGKILTERTYRYFNKNIIAKKTQKFAKMLEELDQHKTAEFVNILSGCLQTKSNLYEVEMSVMDIDDETWKLLSNL